MGESKEEDEEDKKISDSEVGELEEIRKAIARFEEERAEEKRERKLREKKEDDGNGEGRGEGERRR